LRRTLLFLFAGSILLGAIRSDAQILHRKKKVNKSTHADNNAEPDKVLYDRAVDDIKHGKHEVGRLNLQTLINTYPDSEYLAKAKLGIADSYFKEAGTSNMTQAIQGYKDFIVFFPFLAEASYAQLQVAMGHFQQMEKPDRDRTQARSAEDEFQTFIAKYPNDPLAPKAEQHLREVQEVLAEGDFRIGYYYYVKGDRRAAAGRLITLTNRYPLYSKSDHALWMLGDVFEKSEKKDLATNYYARIVRDYPLSELAPDAKNRLKQMGAPVPQADPKAVAWMTAEQNAPRQKPTMLQKPMAFFKNGPVKEFQTASKVGPPNMTPEAESASETDILRGGNGSKIGVGGGTGIVATVQVGDTGGTTSNSENVAPAGDNAPATGAVAPADANAPPATTESGATAVAPSAALATTGTAPAANDGTAKTDAAAGAGQTADAAKADGTQDATPTKNGKESSSKKKKGLKKLIPW
jgi:outer membrane protein assembly factor BamD